MITDGTMRYGGTRNERSSCTLAESLHSISGKVLSCGIFLQGKEAQRELTDGHG